MLLNATRVMWFFFHVSHAWRTLLMTLLPTEMRPWPNYLWFFTYITDLKIRVPFYRLFDCGFCVYVGVFVDVFVGVCVCLCVFVCMCVFVCFCVFVWFCVFVRERVWVSEWVRFLPSSNPPFSIRAWIDVITKQING